MRFDAAKILYFLLFCTTFDFCLVGPLSRVALDVPRAEFFGVVGTRIFAGRMPFLSPDQQH